MSENKQPGELEPTSTREWIKAIVIVAVLVGIRRSVQVVVVAVLLGINALYKLWLWWRREWDKAIVIVAVSLGIAALYMVWLWWLARHILIDS